MYKYITKGPDCAMIIVEVEGMQCEVNSYANNRYISFWEECWRISHFDIADCIPPVMTFIIHLKKEQQMAFSDVEKEVALSQGPETELKAFLGTIVIRRRQKGIHLNNIHCLLM